EPLGRLGSCARGAGGPEPGLELLGNGERVDLVFSDTVMPGPLNGIEFGRKLRERFPDLPVLLATGYHKPAEDAQGEFPVLRKPYQLGELGRAVTHLIANARGGAEPTNLLRFPSGRKGDRRPR